MYVLLLYKFADDRVFDDFPKISEDFPTLFQRPDERSRTFSENFRRCPKISEDFRGRPEDVSMILLRYLNQRIGLWTLNLPQGRNAPWTDLVLCNNTFFVMSRLVQSLNSTFFPPHIGAEPGRAKEESRITCMRMLRTNQSKIARSQPRCSRQCVAQCLSQLAL